MRSPLEHALSSDGLGGFYVHLRPSESLIHATQSFIFSFQKLFNWNICGRNCKKNYQQRIFKYWCHENHLEEHGMMVNRPCCKAE